MPSLSIINVVNKSRQSGCDMRKHLIACQINFFDLKRFYKALSLRVVIRITYITHRAEQAVVF